MPKTRRKEGKEQKFKKPGTSSSCSRFWENTTTPTPTSLWQQLWRKISFGPRRRRRSRIKKIPQLLLSLFPFFVLFLRTLMQMWDILKRKESRRRTEEEKIALSERKKDVWDLLSFKPFLLGSSFDGKQTKSFSFHRPSKRGSRPSVIRD